MHDNGFELAIEIGGRRIPEYGHRGKTFVRGNQGSNYEIKFRNSRAERVLVVPSVDGLSVIDGTPAATTSSGYVVPAYGSLTIEGWRTSLSEIRKFEFSSKSGSYAGKTYGQQNCGVIAAQVYGEQRPPVVILTNTPQPPVWYPPIPPWPTYPSPGPMYGGTAGGVPDMTRTLGCTGPTGMIGASGPSGIPGSQSASYCCSASNQAPDFNLGTAFGQVATSCVNYVTFERGLWLATMEIYYSDREGLIKDGIQVDKSPGLATGYPSAFGGFCKPPA